MIEMLGKGARFSEKGCGIFFIQRDAALFLLKYLQWLNSLGGGLRKKRPSDCLAQAARTARLRLGDAGRAREELGSFGWENVIETVLGDLRQSIRRLVNAPGFTVVAVVKVALQSAPQSMPAGDETMAPSPVTLTSSG